MPGFLTAKIGPLPTWGWMVGGTAVVGGIFAYRSAQTKKAAQQDQVQQQAQIAAEQAAATAAASPYQPYTVPYITSAMTYGNGYAGNRRHPDNDHPDHDQRNNPGGHPDPRGKHDNDHDQDQHHRQGKGPDTDHMQPAKGAKPPKFGKSHGHRRGDGQGDQVGHGAGGYGPSGGQWGQGGQGDNGPTQQGSGGGMGSGSMRTGAGSGQQGGQW